jgi:hypothetical protein
VDKWSERQGRTDLNPLQTFIRNGYRNFMPTKAPSVKAPSSSTTAASAYVDRAQQRREMYGADTPSMAVVADESVSSETVRPDPTLGATNVGNQMLQKFGWKSGQLIGRNNNDESVEATKNNLKKDWGRIEAMTAHHKGVSS